MFDIFIAIPAPVGASNVTLLGSYWVSSLEFPGGGLANIRNTNFLLTSTGAGSFVETSVTGQAANLNNILMSQTVGPITYAISADGSGTMTFPMAAGLDSNYPVDLRGRKYFRGAREGYILSVDRLPRVATGSL